MRRAFTFILALFAACPALAQPDYAKPANWAARAKDEGAAARIAPGASPRRKLRQVDVFYIHPTTDRSRERHNASVEDSAVNAWTDASVIARQAGAFNRCCRMFAPRYRQATLGAGYTGGEAREAAFALAYADVLRAFDHYITHDNGGRPFILAGHSQGAAHLERLLAERIDGKPLQQHLVAAYVIGIGLAEGQFGRTFRSLPICQTPRQTGCVVHWNSMLALGDKAAAVEFARKAYRARFGTDEGSTMLCVNPLTFDRSRPSASRQAAKGAVPGAPGELPMTALKPRAVTARCENGLLVVDHAASLGLEPMPGGSMHYHDIGLFYAEVRANADARAQAFLRQHRR